MESNGTVNAAAAAGPSSFFWPNRELEVEKPIMILLRNVIHQREQLLSNTYIIGILEKDLKIDTITLHELELEIYVAIVKKFLKEWPEAEELKTIITKQNKMKWQEINLFLEEKYCQLRNYLIAMLDAARPLAAAAVDRVQKKYQDQKQIPTEDKHVVFVEMIPKVTGDDEYLLEIQCSRRQLDCLFFRTPHPMKNFTIFNSSVPPLITLVQEELTYDAILNWWNISIRLKFASVHIFRTTRHEVMHTLVNKKLHFETKVQELNQNFQERSDLYAFNLEKDEKELSSLPDVIKIIKCVTGKTLLPLVDTIERDLENFPEEDSFNEPVGYRRYFSKYPYERFLYTDVDSQDAASEVYDLQLRETICPIYQINVHKFKPGLTKQKLLNDVRKMGYNGFQIECKSCMEMFEGAEMLEKLRLHVWNKHSNEPDWQCQKCGLTFGMSFLAQHRWHHICNSVV